MRLGRRMRVPALAVGAAVLLLVSSLPASAAGPKRIFITKTDENFKGQAGVTFELYEDTDGDGVRDDGEPKLQTKVTDAAGAATFDPVNPGKYIVHEVTPAGYVDNPDQAVEIPNAKGKGPTIVFSNTPKPANHLVNDPTGDASLGDGTHIFDFGPSIAVACVEEEDQRPRPPGADPCPDPEVLVAWNRSAGGFPPGGFSFVQTALSTDGGTRWGDYSKLEPGSPSTFILGEPSIVFDPVADRYVAAADAITATGSGLLNDIMVWRSGGPFGFWDNPIHIPGIPLQPAFAHGPRVLVDSKTGKVIVLYTQSNADGTSQPMVTTSTDGGATFAISNPIAGPGSHFDFVDGVIGPDGKLNVVWAEFFGPNDPFDIRFDRSGNPMGSWGSNVTVATGVPRSGTAGQCTSSNARSFFGNTVSLDAPRVAISPLDRNRLFLTFPQHGSGGDEGDVQYTTSTDGGQTWSTPGSIRPADGEVQFSPSIGISPDGRVGVTYFEADAGGTAFDVETAFADAFTDPAQLFVEGVFYIPVMQGSPFWNTDPNFDTHFSNCFGLAPLGMTSPGSGFFMAWADGRDPGPAGNNGVDPNIYFARTEGPPLSTELAVSIDKTKTKVKAEGSLTPEPVPGAKVIVTLLQDTGDGFEQIARKKPKTGNGGAWSTSFARPDGGTCQVIVEFAGAVGRAPSVPLTETFAC